jgi:hypothetical protein
VIDPERHANLIAAQRAIYTADTALNAYSSGLPRFVTDDQRAELDRLRAAYRTAVEAKEAALRDSGLIEEHGYYTAAQALKTAAKAPADDE